MNSPIQRFLGLAITVVAVSSILCPNSAVAQTYPDRAVRLVVPFSPGGSTDLNARLLATQLSEIWKQPVVVENKAGAGGLLGADAVAKSAPDGYTLLMGTEGLSLQPNVEQLPFDWKSDLKLVSLMSTNPMVVLVTAQRKDLNSLKDLVAYGREHKGKLNYGTPGPNTVQHMAIEMFARDFGMVMTHIPFKGTGPALVDLMAGRIDLYFGTLTTAGSYVDAGTLKALAVLGAERLPKAPNMPTAKEAGFPFEMSFWYGVMVSGKTSDAVVKEINAGVVRALNTPQLRKSMTDQGLKMVGSSPDEFNAFFRKEVDGWAKLVGGMKERLKN